MAEKLILPTMQLIESDALFLDTLGAESERLLNRHNDSPKEFFPYDFVDQLDEAILSGEFVPDEDLLSEEVKSSLFVNLITEEGLPYYTSVIERGLPKDHAFREWLYTWTAEEGRHGPAISHWMHKIKQFDMHDLERARMAMMKSPDTPRPESFVEGLVYPAFQEPATEVSHRNTMRLLPQKAHKIGRAMLGMVAGDEKKHAMFYRDMTAAALEVNPSLTINAIAKQVRGFAMPGKSIPGFNEHAKTIEKATIFGPVQLKKIFDDLTNEWNIWHKENLTPEGEQSREFLAYHLERLQVLINRRASQA